MRHKDRLEFNNTLIELLHQRIEPIPEAGCWVYTGLVNPKGYPRIEIGGRNCGVHRIMYEHYRGPIPPGLQLDHLCRVRCCINPDHLEPVSGKINALRGIGPTAQNAKKTVCKNGHIFDHMRWNNRDKVFQRVCLECDRPPYRKPRQRDRQRAQGGP